MKTLNQIVKILKDFSENHSQIKDFQQGNFIDITSNKKQNYPLMFCELGECNATDALLDMDFTILFADQENHSKSNRLEIQSDMLSICNDLYSHLLTAEIFDEEDVNILDNVKMKPFALKFNNQTSGYYMKFTLQINRDSCDIPLDLRITEPDLSPFILVWDDIANVPVADVNSVSDWNTYGGWVFSSVEVIGNAVHLKGSATPIVINNGTFTNNQNILQVIDQANICTAVGISSFENASFLNLIDLPVCEIVNQVGFYLCTSLTNVNLPLCTQLFSGAFADCQTLVTISLPSAIQIRSQAFTRCYALTSVNFPVLTGFITEGGTYFEATFYDATSLNSIYIPSCTSLGELPSDGTTFQGIVGNTINVTCPVPLQTNDYMLVLVNNNTVNFL